MRDIKGYEGLYAVTSCGKVWSYRRKIFMKPQVSGDGYYRISLTKDKKISTIEIHKLVAEAYLEKPEGKVEVNHKDEIKAHNYVQNLEWVNHKENMNHGTRTQRSASKRKGRAQRAIKVYCVELNREFDSMNQAAKELGISVSSISKAVNGQRKTCGGYHWERVERV